jgi:uncharacterized protein YjiS (DUF1127 family)
MAVQALAHLAPVRARAPRLHLSKIFQSAIAAIARRHIAAIHRRHSLDLLALDDHMLEDIGVDRWEVQRMLQSRQHVDPRRGRAAGL